MRVGCRVLVGLSLETYVSSGRGKQLRVRDASNEQMTGKKREARCKTSGSLVLTNCD